ncbi:YIP1 family protein [Flavobacterium sp.]|uniref:YIP1 family protein n=1 Tax=Flavobacterium sp. TaxID=239 RepID=UPI00375107EF
MNSFPEFVDKENTIDGYKVLEKVITAPKRAFKFINTYKYDKHLHILLIISGISNAFNKASQKGMGDDSSLLFILFITIIFGGLFGWITYYFYSALISWTGKWFNGFAKTDDVLRIFAYATIPAILGLVFLIIQISIFGNRPFMSDENYTDTGILTNSIFYACEYFQFALAIWSLSLLVIGVAEIQKFSIWKAILNVFLPAIILFAIVVVFAILIMLGTN